MYLISQYINQLWSIYEFNDRELSDFAEQQLVTEAQQGIKVMSTLLILFTLVAMLLFKHLGQINGYSINYFWVMALAAHINFSARVIRDIKTLHTLGITLLVISATAYVFMAHQAGQFSPLLMANIVLLFMFVPMIPWGLREATAVVMAIYFLLTLSAWNANSHFDGDAFRVLQFFLLAAGTTSLLLVLRATLVRKNELLAHFKLQQAHADLFKLSHTDPLTSAWNRRFTETAVANLVRDFKDTHEHFNFIIFDLDHFKILNDTFGHDFGDQVLVITSQIIIDELGKRGYLIRIGGDEFVIVQVGHFPEKFMLDITQKIANKISEINSQASFNLSWGSVQVPMYATPDLEAVYQQADEGLYKHKQAHRQCDISPVLGSNGVG
jgi:diguanylate cyclase (GGDEF)-like protein